MIFLELVLENFGPYRGRQVINLEPNNGDNPHTIILLGGMNGGGKTTFMDAIRLALYGHRAQCSTRGNLSYNDFLNQCVNTHKSPTDKTRIELAFEHIENDKPINLVHSIMVSLCYYLVLFVFLATYRSKRSRNPLFKILYPAIKQNVSG